MIQKGEGPTTVLRSKNRIQRDSFILNMIGSHVFIKCIEYSSRELRNVYVCVCVCVCLCVHTGPAGVLRLYICILYLCPHECKFCICEQICVWVCVWMFFVNYVPMCKAVSIDAYVYVCVTVCTRVPEPKCVCVCMHRCP